MESDKRCLLQGQKEKKVQPFLFKKLSKIKTLKHVFVVVLYENVK